MRCTIRREPGQRTFDERLGLGARDHYVLRDEQRESPEFAHAGQVRNRLAVAAAPRQRKKPRRLVRCQRFVGVRSQPRARVADNVGEQHLCVDGNQPALCESLRDGKHHAALTCRASRCPTNKRRRLP